MVIQATKKLVFNKIVCEDCTMVLPITLVEYGESYLYCKGCESNWLILANYCAYMFIVIQF